jgi:hypothetical protein
MAVLEAMVGGSNRRPWNPEEFGSVPNRMAVAFESTGASSACTVSAPPLTPTPRNTLESLRNRPEFLRTSPVSSLSRPRRLSGTLEFVPNEPVSHFGRRALSSSQLPSLRSPPDRPRCALELLSTALEPRTREPVRAGRSPEQSRTEVGRDRGRREEGSVAVIAVKPVVQPEDV